MKMKKLEDKCLSGYWYEIITFPESVEGRKMKVQTGAGGAKEFIKIGREEGLSDEVIGSMIIVYTDFGAFPLNSLKVKNESFLDKFNTFLSKITIKELKKQIWYKAMVGKFWKKGEGLCEQMKNQKPFIPGKLTKEDIIKAFDSIYKSGVDPQK